jgi:hypothetical protein
MLTKTSADVMDRGAEKELLSILTVRRRSLLPACLQSIGEAITSHGYVLCGGVCVCWQAIIAQIHFTEFVKAAPPNEPHRFRNLLATSFIGQLCTVRCVLGCRRWDGFI